MSEHEYTPEGAAPLAVRSRDIVVLADQVILTAGLTSYNTPPVTCRDFRRLALYLRVKSSGAPTTVQILLQYYDDVRRIWYDYRQGPWASLYYEDTDTATEVPDVYEAPVAGRQMRVRLVGTGITAANTFTVSVSVEFRA